MPLTETQLDRLFHALSDNSRRQILMRIRERDETVNSIAADFEISLPAISRHLKVLEHAGLISRRREGRKRFCHAEPDMMNDALTWLEFYQSFWSTRLDNLKSHLEDPHR